jgi:hypothetical protein
VIGHYRAVMEPSDSVAAWDAALHRYADMDNSTARFNVTLLDALRPRWETAVRPDTSMFTLLFTRSGSTGYEADERVEVLAEADDRVRMALVRQVPRLGEARVAGPATVTGDFTRPEDALHAVEALLLQLADPDDC